MLCIPFGITRATPPTDPIPPTVLDEGMWLPLLVAQNYAEMRKLGLELTPEQIYSVNQGSLKDALVRFGQGFCTGSFVSSEGLVFTNHHCGYGQIQEHSSVQHDYLTDGFWAMTREQELPNPGLTISILIRMESVTDKIAGDPKNIQMVQAQATEGGKYEAQVRPMFAGNEYWLFVYQTFRDVRLVGAPPSAIGKFGGDTDNWMWPRHTGDFSMFRVYANKDNQPADYSKDNVPYKPKHHLPVSLEGISLGDFSMILGYPGRTTRYLTADQVQLNMDVGYPATIKLLAKRMEVMKRHMDASPEVRIKLADGYASLANTWKKFVGLEEGVKARGLIAQIRGQEAAFQSWAEGSDERKQKYAGVIQGIAGAVNEWKPAAKPAAYLRTAGYASTLVISSAAYNPLLTKLRASKGAATDETKKLAEDLKKGLEEQYKDYDANADKDLLATLLTIYYNDIAPALRPDTLNVLYKKYGGFNKYADYVFSTSAFTSKAKAEALLSNPTLQALQNDPALQLFNVLDGYNRKNFLPKQMAYTTAAEGFAKSYIAGMREMKPYKALYPDANSTMRLTYGTVQDYNPKDAVRYTYLTTLDGMMAKKDMAPKEEFIIPAKLEELYKKKDYGRYAYKGVVPLSFLTNHDITGGNSGSPVINGRGELMGLAYDSNWEGVSGDIVFDIPMQRVISVDIRFVLFVIDKYAGAGHLVREMTLVE